MLNLVLIDDDPDEAYLLRQALTHIDAANDLTHFESSHDLQLDELGMNSLILLDLNMPGNDGFEILKKARLSQKLNSVPIIVYSNSGNPNDITRSYNEGANSYVKKPQNLSDTISFLKALLSYWQGVNKT